MKFWMLWMLLGATANLIVMSAVTLAVGGSLAQAMLFGLAVWAGFGLFASVIGRQN